MKIYLVGGAVRDSALGLPVTERDWVVVGAMPAELLRLGYQQVGRDFPVFLHPTTREEYALARTERKSAHGYYGFDCDFNPNVTLEEDLLRRDLTINAMAQDDAGHVIDPYGGLRDIEEKYLRHVSAAFVDDPVRVLRVARFYARFYALGFQIAEETIAFMRQMVDAGELDYLVPERVWQEWHAALTTQNPEQFIVALQGCAALQVILPELTAYNLEYVINTSRHSTDPIIRFAAIVLELEPALIKALCIRLRIPNDFRELACLSATLRSSLLMSEPWVAEQVVQVFEQADAFRRPLRFKQVLTVLKSEISAQLLTQWLQLLEMTQAIKVLPSRDSQDGQAIKQALHANRVACVQQQLIQWTHNEK
jgi:tRNA nucleotidyltransferase (CCA-adding enzyme)